MSTARQDVSTQVTEASTTKTATRRRQPSFLILIGSISVLLAAGIIVAVMVSRQTDPTYPANSPQGTVSTYLRLLQNGNVDQAYTMTDLTPVNGFPESREAYHQQWDNWSQQSHRVLLLQVHRHKNQASVMVEVTTTYEGGLSTQDYTGHATFTLERSGRRWLITGPQYPYFG